MKFQLQNNKIILLLFISFAFVRIGNANELIIDENFKTKPLKNHIEYSRDFKVNPLFDFNYINSLKFNYSGSIPQESEGAFWIKIPIKNKFNNEIELTIETNRFNKLEVFFFNEKHFLTSVKSGINTPFKNRKLIKGDLSIIPIKIPAKSNEPIYIWVYKPEKNLHQYSISPLTIKKRINAEQDLSNAENSLYFFLGAIILMTLYNFALFMVVRKPGYLYYIAYNILVIFFVLAQAGKLDFYFFETPIYHEKLILILGNISFIFYMLFSKNILKFKRYDPKWNSIVNLSLIVWPFLLIFVFFDYDNIALVIGSLGALTGYFIIIFSCIKAIRKGSISIKYFFIGNLLYFSAIITQILQINEVLPNKIGPFTAIEFVEVGIMLQLALFSLTLGSSINIIKRKLLEKEVDQQKQKQKEQIRLSKVIQQKNIELEKKVKLRTKALDENSKLLRIRNQDINDSLKYARKIQNALLPDKEIWSNILPNSLYLYLPKEVISGDFYWVTERNNRKYFAIADCTGHGIPGAMVSVVGINNLHRCINEYHLEKPNEILDKLSILVKESFESKLNKETVKDGMDIALCSIYEEDHKKVLEYSGANNHLWILRKQANPTIQNCRKTTINLNSTVLFEISADKQPIGNNDNKLPFTNNKFELFEGDEIYLFSDGYVDQFGGPNNKKYKFKNFRALLSNLHDTNPKLKKEKLHESFTKWKGTEEQVDDVCVACIRI